MVDRSVRLGPNVSLATQGSGRVVIGARVEIAAQTTLVAYDGATIEVANDVFIGGLCLIAARRSITIGPETMIAEMVCIRDHDHDPDRPPKSGAMLASPVHIGARVWLGSKSSVVRGGEVGDDSVVGAHGLVNRPIPPGSLAVGVPARVTRQTRGES